MLSYAALAIALGVLLLVRYLKRYSDFKKIELTQRVIEQNKEVPKMVSKIFANHAIMHHTNMTKYDIETDVNSDMKRYDIDNNRSLEEYNSISRWDIDEMYMEDIYFLFNFFSTLADGIDRGIYDEDLIRANFEQDIKLLYRNLQPYVRSLRFAANSDELFLPIEFLLREWAWGKKTKKKKVTFFG